MRDITSYRQPSNKTWQLKNYYQTLEIEFGSDINTIKKAYRRLALKYHPDKNKAPNASELFIEITEAYEVLKDQNKKVQYDNLHEKYNVTFEQESQKTKSAEWKKYGEQKAKEYASMEYYDFAERIIDELKLTINYTPNFFFVLICGFGFIVSFSFLSINILFGLFSIIFYGVLCYFLYDRMKKDYIAERKHKILNKYK